VPENRRELHERARERDEEADPEQKEIAVFEAVNMSCGSGLVS